MGTSPTAGRDIRSKHFIGKKLNKGGEVTSEFRNGGMVDISNFKGQF